MERLNQLDHDLFLILNGLHNAFLDELMFLVSEKYIWIPLYILLAYLLFKQYRWKFVWIIFLTALLILFSDQLSVFIKNTTGRLRPCHEPTLEGLVHVVKNKCGGSYSFVSSHASNHFALATWFGLLFRTHYAYKGFTCLYIWAALIGYSRIYLGKHYPGDIFFGALLGIFIGLLFYYLFTIIKRKI